MKILFFLMFVSCAIKAHSSELKLPDVDIDCDGVIDKTDLFIGTTDFKITVVASSNNNKSSLEFGIGQPSRQDAICGNTPSFAMVEPDTSEMHVNMFGSKIDGYKYSPQCRDIIVSGGECDSITVFFNHSTGILNWWRL